MGKRRLEAALARFPKRDQVEVTWRSFELDPSAPPVRDKSISFAGRLAKKYGVTEPAAQTMIQRVTSIARQDGLDFHFERAQAGNTFNAHRIVHLALARGLQDAVKERLFKAYMSEGEAIGLTDVLVRLATEAGLDEEEAAMVLASDAYATEVRADQQEASELGITGVPFFVIGRYAVSGAQTADILLRALEQAYSELPKDLERFADGAVCGPDGCDPSEVQTQ